MSVIGVTLVRIFPHLDWIRRDTPYLSVFSSNVGKYGTEKLLIWTLFTQWTAQRLITNLYFSFVFLSLKSEKESTFKQAEDLGTEIEVQNYAELNKFWASIIFNISVCIFVLLFQCFMRTQKMTCLTY